MAQPLFCLLGPNYHLLNPNYGLPVSNYSLPTPNNERIQTKRAQTHLMNGQFFLVSASISSAMTHCRLLWLIPLLSVGFKDFSMLKI